MRLRNGALALIGFPRVVALALIAQIGCVRFEYAVRFHDPAKHVQASGFDGRELRARLPGCTLSARMQGDGASAPPKEETLEIKNDTAVAALMTGARAFGRNLELHEQCGGAPDERVNADVVTPGSNVESFVLRDHLPRLAMAFPVILASLGLLFCGPMALGAFDKYPSSIDPDGESFKTAGTVCSAITGGVLAASIGVMVWDPVIERRLVP